MNKAYYEFLKVIFFCFSTASLLAKQCLLTFILTIISIIVLII